MLNSKKMSRSELIILFTSLSYMLTAGMTEREGVAILMQDPNSKLSKHGLQTMIDSFDEGSVLSQVLQNNEDIYGPGLWRQVDAAERTGKVPECLLRIAAQFKASSNIASKIKGALMYPIFVLIIALIASYYLFTTTIPEMGEMMMEFGAELPYLTQVTMSICEFVVEHSMLILLTVVMLFVGVVKALRGPLKLKWHRQLTKFPLTGSISVNVNYSLVYMLLNDMIENGSNAVEALRVAASSADNRFISKELMDCATSMEREGYGIAEALMSASTMPSDDRLMLNVGSQTGRELDVLQDLAVRRRAAANDSIAHLLEMMTPILMIIVCAIVGVLVVSIYLPMLTMASSMQ